MKYKAGIIGSEKIVQKIVLGAVVINHEWKVLIVQRNSDEKIYPNMWELPSGKKEPLETSEGALLREIREETGLEVEILGLVSVFDYQIKKPDEIRDSTQINFLVQAKDEGSLVLSHEHQDYSWIGADETDSYDMSEATKEVIKKAEKISRFLKTKH